MPKPMSPAAEQAVARKVTEKFSGKTYGGETDIRDPHVYYDTYTLDAAGTPAVLFNNAAAKVLSLSNYPFQQLPSAQSFDVTGLRVSYKAHALMDDATQQLLLDFLNVCTLRVSITNKVPVYERNVAALIGGQIQAVTAPAVTVGSRNLSQWIGNTVVKFKRKIYLDSQTPWTVRIEKDAAPNAALTADLLRVEMIGRLEIQV
jgi:hypothetical protein